jgi:hypothetical protein
METEPEMLKLWHRMASSLQRCIKYRHSLKQTVADINVTEIFIKRHGQTDSKQMKMLSRFGVNEWMPMECTKTLSSQIYL